MNVNNIVGKLTHNADKLGLLAGGAGQVAGYAQSSGRTFTDQLTLIGTKLLSDPHFPNIDHVIRDLQGSNVFMGGLKFGALGWVLSEVGLFSKEANLLQKVGFNAAKGAGIVSIVAHCGWAHSPESSGRSFGSSSGGNPYLSFS